MFTGFSQFLGFLYLVVFCVFGIVAIPGRHEPGRGSLGIRIDPYAADLRTYVYTSFIEWKTDLLDDSRKMRRAC